MSKNEKLNTKQEKSKRKSTSCRLIDEFRCNKMLFPFLSFFSELDIRRSDKYHTERFPAAQYSS